MCGIDAGPIYISFFSKKNPCSLNTFLTTLAYIYHTIWVKDGKSINKISFLTKIVEPHDFAETVHINLALKEVVDWVSFHFNIPDIMVEYILSRVQQ